MNEVDREEQQHKKAIYALNAILNTSHGHDLFKYILDKFSLDGTTPPQPTHDQDRFLFEQLGFERAGKSIYNLCKEANSDMLFSLLNQLHKEKEHAARFYESSNASANAPDGTSYVPPTSTHGSFIDRFKRDAAAAGQPPTGGF